MCDLKMKKPTECEDIQDTMCLPDEIVDLESTSIVDLSDLNRQEYEEVKGGMLSDLKLVSSTVDEEAKALMDLALEEIEMTIGDANLSDLPDVIYAEELHFVRDKIKKLHSKIEAIINEYCEDLESLEIRRKKENMEILSKYRDTIDTRKLLDCRSLKDVFQSEIDEINKETLSNLRNIADFRLKLQVRGRSVIGIYKEDFKNRALKIAENEAEHFWKKIEAKRNKTLLEEAMFNMKEETRNIQEDVVNSANNLFCSLSDLCEVLKLSDSGKEKDAQVELLIKMCNNNISILKTATNTLINDFDDEINSLHASLLAKLEACQVENRIDIKSLTSITEEHSLHSYQNKEIEEFMCNIKVTVDAICNNIRQVIAFVDDLKSIWTDYSSNIDGMYKQLDFEWEEFNKLSIKLKADIISKVKVQTKLIREAKDEDKLNSFIGDIEKMLDVSEEKLDSEFKSIMSSLLDLKNKNIEKISEEKLSNIEVFLYEKYQNSTWLKWSIECDSTNVERDIESGTLSDKCNKFTSAVDYTALGMYDTVERFLPQCKVKIVQKSDDSFRIFCQNAISKYNNELDDFIQVERKNIKNVKHIRSGELMYHSDRLMSHSLAVKGVISKVNQESQELKNKKQSIVEDLTQSVARILQDLPTDTSKQIKYAILELENKWNVISGTLEGCVNEAKDKCDKQFGIVERSNVLFTKAAVNFKNGGNYSPEEIKILSKELKRLGKDCVNQKRALVKNYNNLLSGVTKRSLDLEIEKLKEKLKHVVLVEDLQEDIKTLRVIIRAEVENMKATGRVIDEKLMALSYRSMIDERLTNDISDLLNTRYDYMTFPPGMLSLESEQVNINMEPVLSSKATSPSKHEKSKKPPDTKNTKLFQHSNDEMFTDPTNYFTRTKGVMLRKYNHLIERVQDTFQSNASVMKSKTATKQITNRQDPVADSHRNVIKSACLAYNKECELAWFCEAKQFIRQIRSLRRYANTLTKRELKLNHKEYMNKSECIQEEYQLKTKKERNKQAQDRKQISQTLVLPLAHPLQQHKLNELMKKAKDLCRTQTVELDNMIQTYKDDLQTNHDQYVEIIRLLKEKSSAIQSLFINPLSNKVDDFVSTVESVSGLIQPEVNNLVIEEPSDNGEHFEYPKSLWSDDENGFTTLNTTSAWEFDDDNDANCAMLHFATELVKKSADLSQKFYDEAKSYQIENEKSIASWMKALKYDVEQCKLAYKSFCH